MNPVAISRGHSFKHLTAYLHHSKEGDARYTFTEADNLGTQNPYMAARLMAATAMDAKRKQAKGPVWHGSISWDEDHHPDPQHQAAAARAMLKQMGLEQAQALLVGHNDNGRTHVHIMVNLINPETGRIWHDPRYPDNASRNCLYQEHSKMQAFAREYCREHGITSSPNREKNAKARADRAAANEGAERPPEPKPVLEGTKRLSRAEWQRMKDELFARQQGEREQLKAKHGGEWASIKAEIEKRQKAARADWRAENERQRQAAKAEFKPNWAALFKAHRTEDKAISARINQAARQLMKSQTIVGRALGAVGFAKTSFQWQAELATLKMQRETMLARHEAQQLEARQVQGRLVAQRTKQELAKREAPRLDVAPVKETQNREWTELRTKQAEEREAAGLRPRPEKVREQENRQAERERTARDQQDAPKRNKWGATISDEQREQARRRADREREQARQQAKERGRSRGIDD